MSEENSEFGGTTEGGGFTGTKMGGGFTGTKVGSVKSINTVDDIIRNPSSRVGINRRNPELPISAHGARMLAKWQDPEYRASVSERMKKRWAEPEYRAMIMEKVHGGGTSPKRLTRAAKFRKDADTLKRAAQDLLNRAATLVYHAALMERVEYDGKGLVLSGKVIKTVGQEFGL